MLSKKEAKALVRIDGCDILEQRINRPHTRVILCYKHDKSDYYGVGECSHKRSDAESSDPRLAWDEDFGIRIATGRAEKDIVEQLMDQRRPLLSFRAYDVTPEQAQIFRGQLHDVLERLALGGTKGGDA